MAQAKFDNSPVEPAHPMIVELHDSLTRIYQLLRAKAQTKIDAAFDKISREIGYVVTTTIPMTFVFDEEGDLKSVEMGAEHLKGTLFESKLLPVLRGLPGKDRIKGVAAGKYNLYVIWYDALKLKLRTDWMEPAHVAKISVEKILRGRPWLEPAHPGGHWLEPAHMPGIDVIDRPEVVPGVKEPAHWFDPGIFLPREEAVLITVIDEVYPELQLTAGIAKYREMLRHRAVRPDVQEPAHFRKVEDLRSSEFMAELSALLKRHGY